MIDKTQRLNNGIRDKSPCASCPAEEKYTAYERYPQLKKIKYDKAKKGWL